MPRPTTLWLHTLVLAAAALAACAPTTPALDLRQGESVRALRAQQTLDPGATARNTAPVLGLDGKAARGAMENYRDAFRTPPSEARTPQTVINNSNGN